MKPTGIQLKTKPVNSKIFSNNAHLGWTTAKYKIKCMILYDGRGACFFDQGVEGIKVGSVWGDVVHYVSYSVRLALHHNMFHTRFMPVLYVMSYSNSSINKATAYMNEMANLPL